MGEESYQWQSKWDGPFDDKAVWKNKHIETKLTVKDKHTSIQMIKLNQIIKPTFHGIIADEKWNVDLRQQKMHQTYNKKTKQLLMLSERLQNV